MSRSPTRHFPFARLTSTTGRLAQPGPRFAALSLLAFLAAATASMACEAGFPLGEVVDVRTTAYTHTEASHLKYGTKNAVGKQLRYGNVRSAAADWSRYPLGTRFRIAGSSETYEIDDYGSALVGKNTIDLYKPTTQAMNRWGVQHLEIEIIEWGSFEKSLAILLPRARNASHVAAMVRGIRAKAKSQGDFAQTGTDRMVIRGGG